jgi:hypothetical protein
MGRHRMPPIRGDLTGSVTKPDNRAAATTAHDNNLCAAIVAEHRGKAGG